MTEFINKLYLIYSCHCQAVIQISRHRYFILNWTWFKAEITITINGKWSCFIMWQLWWFAALLYPTKRICWDRNSCNFLHFVQPLYFKLTKFISFQTIIGTRYKRRGVDDEGHCANYVETEQVLLIKYSCVANNRNMSDICPMTN